MYTSQMAATITINNAQANFFHGTLRAIRGFDTNTSAITSLRSYAFCRQYNLVYVSLPFLSYIGSDAFAHCTSLKSIYLMSTKLCTLAHSNAFSSCTALTSICVPSTLLTSYKAATNWTYYSAKMYSYTNP